jgi:hypothetical protein
MAAFGLGSATFAAGRRIRVARSNRSARPLAEGLVFGIVLLLVGASVASGADKVVESVVLARLPHWWIELLAGA